jgi:hypothetical protein
MVKILNISQTNEQKKNKNEQKKNKNPLSPLRRYMIDYSKVSKDINTANDYQNDKIQ